ncbi:MAG TPA: hypothetical protein V6C78_26060 [Crinalium sp.]
MEEGIRSQESGVRSQESSYANQICDRKSQSSSLPLRTSSESHDFSR